MSNQTVTQNNEPRRTQLHRGRRTRFKVMVGVGAVVVVLLLAFIVDSGLYYNKVHAGVSVSGLSLSRLTSDEAVAALTAHVAQAQATPINLTGGGKTWDIVPTDVGVEIDVAGAISAAMDVTRESNFFVDLGRRIKLYFSHTDLPLKGTIDSAKMESVLAGIARELDVPAVSAGLAMEGTEIVPIEGRSGNVVDQDTLRDQLTSLLFSLHATELPVPMMVVEPEVRAEDNEAAMDQARTMIASPLELKNGENSWTLSPSQIAGFMEFKSEVRNGVSTLVPFLSASKMTSFFTGISTAIVAKEPVDASFDSDGKTAWVVPGIPGEKLDPEGTAEALTAAALETTQRTAQVVMMEAEPDLTTAEAEAMGIKDKLGSYETEPYSGSSNRQVNVRITTEYASNVILAPGEEYNFETQVGPRTPDRGYKLAPGIVGNGEMKSVYGGGICQVSTTLFNAVFEAGLEIVERHNHSLYISHYPDGRDATIAPPGKNLRFKNDTDHYIWITGTSDGVHTRFTIYGTDDGRKVDIKFNGFHYGAGRTEATILNSSLAPGEKNVKISGQSGRSCSVTRTVTMPDGTVLHNGPEIYKSDYPMIPKLTEVGPSTTTTTAGTNTTTTTLPSTSTTESTTTTSVVVSF